MMVLRPVASDDDPMLSFIFPHDLKLNMEAYIKSLGEVVLSSIESVTAERP